MLSLLHLESQLWNSIWDYYSIRWCEGNNLLLSLSVYNCKVTLTSWP